MLKEQMEFQRLLIYICCFSWRAAGLHTTSRKIIWSAIQQHLTQIIHTSY